MLAHLERLLRHALYALRGGFLLRPLAMALAIGAAGALLPLCEAHFPLVDEWAARLPVLVARDTATAQGILAAIIGAIMTVVSIVLSVLLVALTLASMQFSPRILTGFVEDIANQRTIGLFLGTFLYCLCVFPASGPMPAVGVPVLAIQGAIALAVACSATLVSFIFHIARSINVQLHHRAIAAETERVIDDVLPDPINGRLPEPQPVPCSTDPPSRLRCLVTSVSSMAMRFVRSRSSTESGSASSAGSATSSPRGAPLPVHEGEGGKPGRFGRVPRALRHRPRPDHGAGRRVRDSAARRHCPQGDISRRQRPQHGHQLHRSAQSSARTRRRPRAASSCAVCSTRGRACRLPAAVVREARSVSPSSRFFITGRPTRPSFFGCCARWATSRRRRVSQRTSRPCGRAPRESRRPPRAACPKRRAIASRGASTTCAG